MSSEALEIGRVVDVSVQGDLVIVEEVEVVSTEWDDEGGLDIVKVKLGGEGHESIEWATSSLLPQRRNAFRGLGLLNVAQVSGAHTRGSYAVYL